MHHESERGLEQEGVLELERALKREGEGNPRPPAKRLWRQACSSSSGPCSPASGFVMTTQDVGGKRESAGPVLQGWEAAPSSGQGSSGVGGWSLLAGTPLVPAWSPFFLSGTGERSRKEGGGASLLVVSRQWTRPCSKMVAEGDCCYSLSSTAPSLTFRPCDSCHRGTATSCVLWSRRERLCVLTWMVVDQSSY